MINPYEPLYSNDLLLVHLDGYIRARSRLLEMLRDKAPHVKAPHVSERLKLDII